MKEKKCVHCGKVLEGRKRKYCSTKCEYWYNAIRKDDVSKLSTAQCLRMVRAGRNQRAGRVGCRYN